MLWRGHDQVSSGFTGSVFVGLLLAASTLSGAVKLGDVDESGEQNIFDIVLLTNHRLGITPLPENLEFFGDVNGDQVIDLGSPAPHGPSYVGAAPESQRCDRCFSSY